MILNSFLQQPKFKKNGDVKDVLAVALPMLLSMSFDTFMTFIDRLFLSKLGPCEMNAALGGGGTQIVMMNLFVGVLSYATALTAQRLGAKKEKDCSRVCVQSLYLSLFCIPLVIATIPFGYFLFEMQDLIPEQMEPQKLYFRILILGSGLMLVRNVLANFFSGIGEAKIVMKAAFVAMVVNIVANYFLIFGKGPFPALGVAGAAYGTLIGTFVSVVMLFVVYFSRRNRERFGTASDFRFHFEIMKELLKRGIPCGIEFFLNMFAFQSLLFLFHGLGAVSATAASVMFNWDMVAYVPLMGLEIASTSLVGRYVGAKQGAAAKRSTFSGLKLGWGYSLIIGILFIFMPGVLTDIFKPDVATATAESIAMFEAARPMSIFMLRIAIIYIFVEVLLVIYAGALRGAGDTVWVMFASAIMNWTVTGALFLAAYVFDAPAHHAWIAVVALYGTAPLFFWWRWRSGKWRRHVLEKT
ncbi:MAG: MATE family efflux transporter [Fibrobacter sp.]|nr:MATE family efflux transporter [Fibrobacter sp.]